MNITVAIPSYNKEKYIRKCLDSIVKNKEDISKIIVVDNCSTDKTFEIAKSYVPDVTSIQNETNLGMSPNWNRCIDVCETEWLMIFHADDEMLPGAIKIYKDFIKKYPTVGLIHANSYSMIENSGQEKTLSKIEQKEYWTKGEDAMKCHYGVCSAVLVKKEVYDKVGYFIKQSLSSDAEMWSRIASKYDVGFINEPTVVYFVNAASTGPISLTKRSVKEIKADWDLLNEQMASHYESEVARKKFWEDIKKHAPGNYFNIVKANIRVGNYIKALQATKIIVIDYNGLFPLLTIVFSILKKHIKAVMSKIVR